MKQQETITEMGMVASGLDWPVSLLNFVISHSLG
jgi:hypothetical protein